MSDLVDLPFTLSSLRGLPTQELPLQVATEVCRRIRKDESKEETRGAWIHVRAENDLLEEAAILARKRAEGQSFRLYGVPFAVKDNIDVAGVPTTCACPAFAYTPEKSATVVQRLRDEGALFIGKTNLDQFATGLTGTRSPYPFPKNPFDPAYVSGGSSSGSASAVARGHVAFALGTDTAGSGRIPAAFHNIVGCKPSRGLFSTSGVVPACRSLDCVSIFALTGEDARDVAEVATSYDPADPYSQQAAPGFGWQPPVLAGRRRWGVPRDEDLAMLEGPARDCFADVISRLKESGTVVRVDMRPFFEAGRLLYEGPFLAERLGGLLPFLSKHPAEVLPVLSQVLEPGHDMRGTDVFRGLHRQRALAQAVAPLWSSVEALVTPTAPMVPSIAEVLADPIAKNAAVGVFTTFGNVLDLSAVSVPAGFSPNGLPFGVSFVGPWGRDATLLALASSFHRESRVPLGRTSARYPSLPARLPTVTRSVTLSTSSTGARMTAVPPRITSSVVRLAVVGAHLKGQPLNHQLLDIGATLLASCNTAPTYALYALPGTTPPKPGLLHVGPASGNAIEVEVWGVPTEQLGGFISQVSAPLCIGSIELEDGERVHGFLCESKATEGARDISHFGGWRAFLRPS